MSFRSILSSALGLCLLLGLFVIVWLQGRAAPTGHLFDTASKGEEAGYCLAAAERISEITRGAGDPRLERHLDEQIDFWRGRVGQEASAGRARLMADLARPGQNEGAQLHLAIQDCAQRAVALYGWRFPSMEGG